MLTEQLAADSDTTDSATYEYHVELGGVVRSKTGKE